MTRVSDFIFRATLEGCDEAAMQLRHGASSFLAGETLDMFEIAAMEALTNITQYAYRDIPSGRIAARLEHANGSLRLTLRDQGHAPPEGVFDILPEPSNDHVPEPREHGWGVQLMHRCANRVDFQRLDGWNEITLTFEIPLEGEHHELACAYD